MTQTNTTDLDAARRLLAEATARAREICEVAEDFAALSNAHNVPGVKSTERERAVSETRERLIALLGKKTST